MSAGLIVDRQQIERFVGALLRYCDEGTHISFRAFDQFDDNAPPIMIRPIAVNGDPTKLIDAAVQAAQDAEDHPKPSVFAPPVATFTNPRHARAVDVANGVCLSVELDDYPTAGRQRLESLLGPATLVIESGSEWINPETGEIERKLHIHWRLSEPTRTQEEHQDLNSARGDAALLAGADPSGKPTVHCYRWPGSWNIKSAPRMARIVVENSDVEIHLADAVELLRDAVEAAGLGATGHTATPAGQAQAAIHTIKSAMEAVPNDDVHYKDWIRLGYAVFNATGGAPEAFEIWEEWSKKSQKYRADFTEATWRGIVAAITGTDAPVKIGAGTIFWRAKASGWKRTYLGMDAEEGPTEDAGTADDAAREDRSQAGAAGERLFDPWDELQPPPFPIDALPPVLRRFVEDRSRVIGADPCAIAWAAISAASAALDGSVRLRMKQHDRWSVPPAIWIAIIGPPSTKKSPIIDAAWRPLLVAQEADLVDWRARVRDWKALPKNDRDPEEPVPHRRLVSHDATMEAIQSILGRQDRGIGVLRSELAGFIGAMEKYAKGGAADRAFWLQSFDGGANVVDRVARGTIALNNLLTTVCGGIQPDRLRQFSDITDDGLWQRFLPIIAGPATRGVDEESSGQAVAEYEEAINRLLKVPGNIRAELSKPAHGIRNEVEDRLFELEQSGVLGARFASFVGKLAGIWGRLALVLNYLEPEGLAPFIVTEAAAKRAQRLLFESALPCAARVYAATGGAGADVEATRAVAGYILVKRKDRILASDLSHNVRACRGQPLDVVQRVVSPLVAGGWMVPEKEYNPNSWVVAPHVHQQFEARTQTEATRRAAVHGLMTGKAKVDADAE